MRLRAIQRNMVRSWALALILISGQAVAIAASLQSDDMVVAGSSVTVVGEGYLPLVIVGICWDAPGCSDLGTASPQGLPSAGFRADIVIPSSAGAGPHSIHACQLAGSDLTCAQTGFEVLEDRPVSTTLPATTTLVTTTTSLAPASSTLDQGPVVVEGAGETERPPAPGRTEDALAASTSDQQVDTSTTVTATTSSREPYRPPPFARTSPDEPAANGPVIHLEAAEAPVSALAYLDNPLIFWAAWLVVVSTLGTLASVIGRFLRRRDHA